MTQLSPRSDFWIKTIEASFDQGWFSSLQTIAYDTTAHRVAAGGDKGTVAFLDLATGHSRESSSLNDKIRSLCFGAAGELFVGTENGKVARLSAGHCLPELIQKVSDKAITCLAFHRCQGLLAGSDDRRLRLIDTNTLAVQATSPKEGSYVQDVAFSPDGTKAHSAGCDNCLRVYDLPNLAVGEIAYKGSDSQREVAASNGFHAVGSKDGVVTIIQDNRPEGPICLPVSSDEIVSVLIPRDQTSLLTVDAKGRMQEWGLPDVRPISALDSDLTTKAAAISHKGDVAALCSDGKVVAYVRASAVKQIKALQEYKYIQNSFSGLIQRLIRLILRQPPLMAPVDPQLPDAAAKIATRLNFEELAYERSISDAFVSCYDAIASSAKMVNWKEVAKAVQEHERVELEKQKQELQLMREVRLAQAAEEAKRRREFRERVYRDRQEAQRQAQRMEEQRLAEEQRRSSSFWRGVNRLLSDDGSSSSGDSSTRTRQVRSYTRKDGTRVRSYKRR
jgi:hypothetical protein